MHSKKYLFPKLILLLVVSVQCYGQNLVPNPSFENYNLLSCNFSGPPGAFNPIYPSYDTLMVDWNTPTWGTSDVYSTLVDSSCFSHCFSTYNNAWGHQAPRTGDLMSGIFCYNLGCTWPLTPNYREYIQVPLTSPLVVGQLYYAEMYVSKAEKIEYASNNLGMYFSDTTISQLNFCHVLSFTPQINETSVISDTTNWVKISGNFIASSPAQYLIIGNFYNDSSTTVIPTYAMSGLSLTNGALNAYYYIDDVVVESTCQEVSSDTVICLGDSATLSVYSDNFTGWATDTLPGTLVSSDTILIVSPQVTTTYLAYSTCDTTVVTVTVDSEPISIDFGIDTILCDGEVIILNAFNTNATYVWQNGLTYPTHYVDTSGVYVVEVEKCGNSIIDSISVILQATPDDPIPYNAIACEGEPVILTAIGSGIGDMLFYSDDQMPPIDTVSMSGDPVANSDQGLLAIGGYWFYAAEEQGVCSSDLSPFYVNVQPNPLAPTGVGTTICAGDSATISASGQLNLYWYDTLIPSPFSLIGSGSTYTSEPLFITTDFYVLVETTQGCVSPVVAVTVTVNPLPPVDAGVDQNLCLGDTIALSGTGANTYVWDNGVLNGIDFIPSSSGSYVVTGTDTIGCMNSDTVNITVNPLPLVDGGVDQNVCVGDSTVLIGGGANTYIWDNGVVNGIDFIPGSSGVYVVIGTDTSGCMNSDSVNITLNQSTTGTFVDSGIDVYIINGDTFNLSGIYTQIITNQQGCDSIVTLDLTIGYTGFIELNLENLVVYPNPSSGKINIDGWSNFKGIETVVILDSRGRLVQEVHNAVEEIDLYDFENGVYFLKVLHSNGVFVTRFVKYSD